MSQGDFVCIGEPFNAMAVAMTHATLTGTDIHYFIQNENTAAWEDGVAALASSRMRLMAEPERAEEARRLLDKSRAL